MSEATDPRQTFNREIRSKARDLTIDAFQKNQSAVNAVNELADWLTGEISASEAENLDRVACEAGCAWCCYQQVGVTPLQALQIAAAIRTERTEITTDEAMTSLRTLDASTRGISRIERLAMKAPCAFLKDNRCSIYNVRPYACRGANSVDVSHCQSLVEKPDDARAEWERGATPAWIHALPFEAMKAVQDGLRDGVIAKDLPDDRLELTAAILIALEDEEADQKWRRGESVFSPAKLADA